MPDKATFRDLILAVRADECIHREVNHYFSDLGPQEEVENFDIHIVDQEDAENKIDQSLSGAKYEVKEQK